MIYAYLLVLLALALAGAYVAHSSKIPALYIILSVALLVAGAGIWTGGLYPSSSDLCLNQTIEDSHYWNCSWYDEGRQELINGTCDSVNVTHLYDYCEPLGVTAPEADGAIWAGMFALLSLLLLSVGIIEFMGGNGGATVPTSQSAE